MITINIVKAKNIAHVMRRGLRSEAFRPLDVKVTIPNESEQAEIDRAAIRANDSELQVLIDSCTDISELKSIMPTAP
tara:strand:+ start:577 stop:807 length:231 start_codon:yes stop_codon:yes gene_type:complete